MSNKKTQAQNAMKPAPAAKADEAPETKTSPDTESENQAGGGAQEDSSGKQPSDKAKKAETPASPDGEKAPAEKEAGDYNLDDPEQAAALFEEVINGLVSFGPAVTGALSRKPKVEEAWNELVRKARKIQSKINHEKDKARK